VAGLDKVIGLRGGEAGDHAVQRVAHVPDRGLGLLVGSAEGLGEDFVNDAVQLQVPCRQLQRLGGLGGPARIAKDDRSASLGRYDREV
jgi:hypothetical protein